MHCSLEKCSWCQPTDTSKSLTVYVSLFSVCTATVLKWSAVWHEMWRVAFLYPSDEGCKSVADGGHLTSGHKTNCQKFRTNGPQAQQIARCDRSASYSYFHNTAIPYHTIPYHCFISGNKAHINNTIKREDKKTENQ